MNEITAAAQPTTSRDYCDLVITNRSAPKGIGGDGSGINLWPIGSRVATAVIRNGFLWTCQAVGLSGTNGVNVGDDTGASVDRSGVQWFKLSVDAVNGSLAHNTRGRIWDPASNNPHWYFFPSLMVNCAGDMVAAFSGSSATNFIGAYYTWRSADGHTAAPARLIQKGTIWYPNRGWGDYSATSLDPTDERTFWTVQQYADVDGDPAAPWGTVISRITLAP